MTMGVPHVVALALAALVAVRQPAAPEELRIAAASDLQAALPDITDRFEKETGQKVSVTFGSSGNFFAQIQNGAPFDLFMSADVDYPKQLAAARLADGDTLYEYATGRLVVWTRNGSGVNVSRGLQSLADSQVRRVAIANPAHAPYGRAAEAALRHEGLYDRVKDKLVLGENISQAAQFAQSGNAEAGIIALSLAVAPGLRSAGTYAEIPSSFHPPIEQAAIVIASSPHKALARRFLEALGRPESLDAFRSFGFAVPLSSAH